MDIKGEVFNNNMGLALRLQKVAAVVDTNLFDYDAKNTMPSYNPDYDFFESTWYAQNQSNRYITDTSLTNSSSSNDSATSGDLLSNGSTNGTYFEEYELYYRHSTTMTIVYCVAYFIVFIVGLIGNSFVIAVVFRMPRMRTVTNFFIVNLAVADILVIVCCLPGTLMSNIFVPWVLGWLMCKTVPYIQGVSVAASIYSLIAVSLDRFLAIWWPLKMQITKSRSRIIILCIWLVALSSTIPWALFFDLVSVYPDSPDLKICLEIWPPGTNSALYFLLANLVACYLLPMILISICYILIYVKVWTRSIPGDSKDAQMEQMQQKSKIKVIKMLVIVIILFVLSWLPLYVIFARIKLGGPLESWEEEVIDFCTPIAQWLGASNSCINPILYAFFNKKYRHGFAAIVRSKKCCGRIRYYEPVMIASSSTSTRKSSHHHQSHTSVRRPPYSPSNKSEPVAYIYEHNGNGKKHATIAKQESNLSRQMLIKQDSSISRQDSQLSRQLFKKHYSNESQFSRQDSGNSCQMLIKQDSASSNSCCRNVLLNQDSLISYIEPPSRLPDTKENTCTTPSERRGILCKQDTQISYIENSNNGSKSSVCSQDMPYVEHKRHQLIKQDSVMSFADERPRRHQLIKQDSIISFADQPTIIGNGTRCYLNKQDSSGSHTSILKKTDSRGGSSSASPIRKTIGFFNE